MAPPSENVFWRQVFQDPRKVGAIGPSSRELAEVVVRSARVESARTIIELGPGGGVITEEIIRRKPAASSFLALENNPALIEPLRERFQEAAFVETCASRLPEVAVEWNMPEAESIISTLPWTLFGQELQSRIIAGVRQCLTPGGSVFDRSLLRHSFAASRPHPEDPSGCALRGRYHLSDHLREYAPGVCLLVYVKLMKLAPLSGLAGAIATTILNEIFRRFVPYAPRLDVLGLRLASAGVQLAGLNPPRGPVVRVIALLGDLVSNSIFFGLIGLGRPRHPLVRGGALGLAMGIGAVALPEPLGLGKDTTARTEKTVAQTIFFYVAGGVLAALAFQFSRRGRNS